MSKSPLRFTYPFTVNLDGHGYAVDADLTFHPGTKDSARHAGEPGHCQIHSAIMTDETEELGGMPVRPSHGALCSAAQEAADLEIEAIAAEAAARLVIEKENAEVRRALRDRPINQPRVDEPVKPAGRCRMERDLVDIK